VTMQCFGWFDHEMRYDARMAPGKPFDDAGNETRSERGSASNPHLSSRRVGEKLDVLHALAQVIEYGRSAIEQRATVLRRLDPLAVAVEQAHAEGMLQFRDRSRNRRLGAVEAFRRLPHAASLHHGHEDVEVLQLQPASDAIAQLHGGTHVDLGMISS